MARCALCFCSINKDDPTVWKEVHGFVGGPKKDSMRLRKDTGHYAHNDCVIREQRGQSATQPDMFGENDDSASEV